jgi:hypothetical protein
MGKDFLLYEEMRKTLLFYGGNSFLTHCFSSDIQISLFFFKINSAVSLQSNFKLIGAWRRHLVLKSHCLYWYLSVPWVGPCVSSGGCT